jgi:hypothetical protein
MVLGLSVPLARQMGWVVAVFAPPCFPGLADRLGADPFKRLHEKRRWFPGGRISNGRPRPTPQQLDPMKRPPLVVSALFGLLPLS